MASASPYFCLREKIVRLEFAALADYAASDASGKLTVVGIFDRIFAQQVPVVWPDMVLLLRFRIHRSELGTAQKVLVKLATEDGRALMQIEGDFTPGAKEGTTPLPESTVNHILRFQGLTLPAMGVYTFDVLINNTHVGGAQVAVVPPQA